MSTRSSDLPWTPFEVAEDIPEVGDHLIFVNSRYQVNVRYIGELPIYGKTAHLSIKLRDKAPVRKWRDLQRIKNEICGPECEAVEIFPAESNIVDTSNQYHLWVFESYKFPFGFREGRVLSEDTSHGSVQEPFEWKPDDLGARDADLHHHMIQVQSRIGLRKAQEIATKQKEVINEEV